MQIQIKDVKKLLSEGKKILVKTKNNEYTNITNYIEKGVLDTFKVTLKNNFNIKVSADHRFYTNAGWIKTKDLNINTHSILCEDNKYHNILSIIPIGKHKIVDISVEHPDQCYFGNGMLNHNSGKTLLAMYAAKKVQESGGYIVWVDSETAFSNTLADLVGLKYKISDGFLYLAPKIIDETFSVFERTLIMLREKYPDKKVLLVWDSLAGSRPRAEMEGEYGDKTMGLAAREYSTGFGRIVDTLGKLNVTMLVTNQVRSNIGNTWEPVISYGGKALKFYASIRIVLTQAAKIKDKDNNNIGNIIRAKVVKNRFAPPFRECEFSMYYNRGVDEWESVIEILCKTPFLVKKGGWYNLQNDEKSYRKEEIIKMLKTDKSFYESAMEHFNKEMIIVNDIDGDERIETEDGDVLDSNGALLFNQKDKDKLEAKLSENRVVVEEV